VKLGKRVEVVVIDATSQTNAGGLAKKARSISVALP
jgi:hypothetical protein